MRYRAEWVDGLAQEVSEICTEVGIKDVNVKEVPKI